MDTTSNMYLVPEKEINHQKQAARPESRHIGTVGQRIKLLRVTCEKVIVTDGAMCRPTYIHKMVDSAGNDLTWFCSTGRKLVDGETAYINGTVKEHSEFRGRKQTILSRFTVWSSNENAEAEIEKEAVRGARKAAKAVTA